jgi:alpha-glucosidase
MHNDKPKENWANKGVVYQIYPRSFFDTNSDGIGDLRGIIRKLDYLNDGTNNSLGVNTIWFNPIYKSPQKDFGYDISDYYSIDPIFGDLQTFTRLVEELHRRKMRLIMDFVPNHTSEEHPWFLESRASKDNPKRNWYIWRDPKPDGSPPNNWLSVFGGSAWTLDKETKQYYLHTFLKTQPDLNWRNSEVKTEMIRILKFWIHRGVDGFRTDAVYHLIKDAKFRDDPPNPDYIEGQHEPYMSLLHTYSSGQKELYETANALCQVLGAHEEKFMVSEAYLDIPAMEKMYDACENNLHAPLNFNLMSMPWEAKEYKTFIDEFNEKLGPEDVPNYVLGNHDRSRIATRMGKDKARIAAMITFSLRGMPFIYYGDELGMEDVSVPSEQLEDTWGKNLPGFKVGRDPERTPMQWDNTENAGFSDVKPWLPIAKNYEVVNAKAEIQDPRSFFSLYRALIYLRANVPALIYGSYEPYPLTNNQVFSFIRSHKGKKLFIAFNFSNQSQSLACESINTGKILCSTYMDHTEQSIDTDFVSLTLRPYEGCIFEVIS